MERNEVIATLERCWKHECDKCDWRDGASGYPWSCPRRNHAEKVAIKLLKAQVPRVMTLDEIYDCTEGDCLYYQCKGEFDGNVLYIWSEVGFYVDLRAAIHRFTCEPSLYGSMWRCWTSRPSAELMANTPWEGDAE